MRSIAVFLLIAAGPRRHVAAVALPNHSRKVVRLSDHQIELGLIACRIEDLGLEIEAEHTLMAGGILRSLLCK